MVLKEIAIDQFRASVEQDHKYDLENTEKFAVKAKEILEGTIGKRFPIEVISKKHNEILLKVEDIVFVVNNSGVFVRNKCEKCETEYDVYIATSDKEKVLREIGGALSERHNDYDCQEIMRKKSGDKESTTGEKLLEVLRDFVLENMYEDF